MKKKILVVDDEITVTEVLSRLFSRKGYKTSVAHTGEEAVRIAKEEKPDLVLLDIKLPGMDGLETLKQIRYFDKEVKIIMLTAIEVSDLEKLAHLAGANGFLRKPMGLSMISQAVEENLKEKLPSDNMEAHKILIVDDDEAICSLLEDFLTKKGYVCAIAICGKQALEKVREEKPDIILLDIRMPDMDGLTTLKKIKEIDNKAGIIMITGLDQQNVAEEAIRLGAHEYITKPFDLDYLELAVMTKIFF